MICHFAVIISRFQQLGNWESVGYTQLGQNLNEVTFAFLIVSSLSGSMISYCNEAKFGNAINCLAIHNNKNQSERFVPWIHNDFEAM